MLVNSLVVISGIVRRVSGCFYLFIYFICKLFKISLGFGTGRTVKVVPARRSGPSACQSSPCPRGAPGCTFL